MTNLSKTEEEIVEEVEKRYKATKKSFRGNMSHQDMAFLKGAIGQALARQRNAIKAECERKIAIHQEIIDTHEILPRDWHEGNIKGFSDITKYLTNSPKE